MVLNLRRWSENQIFMNSVVLHDFPSFFMYCQKDPIGCTVLAEMAHMFVSREAGTLHVFAQDIGCKAFTASMVTVSW